MLLLSLPPISHSPTITTGRERSIVLKPLWHLILPLWLWVRLMLNPHRPPLTYTSSLLWTGRSLLLDGKPNKLTYLYTYTYAGAAKALLKYDGTLKAHGLTMTAFRYPDFRRPLLSGTTPMAITAKRTRAKVTAKLNLNIY